MTYNQYMTQTRLITTDYSNFTQDLLNLSKTTQKRLKNLSKTTQKMSESLKNNSKNEWLLSDEWFLSQNRVIFEVLVLNHVNTLNF